MRLLNRATKEDGPYNGPSFVELQKGSNTPPDIAGERRYSNA